MTYLNNTYSINCFNIDKKLLHFFCIWSYFRISFKQKHLNNLYINIYYLIPHSKCFKHLFYSNLLTSIEFFFDFFF